MIDLHVLTQLCLDAILDSAVCVRGLLGCLGRGLGIMTLDFAVLPRLTATRQRRIGKERRIRSEPLHPIPGHEKLITRVLNPARRFDARERE
jgi:hypothetical protein